MHSRALLFINVCFVGWIAAFDIDKTPLTVNIKGSEITVTVPGMYKKNPFAHKVIRVTYKKEFFLSQFYSYA